MLDIIFICVGLILLLNYIKTLIRSKSPVKNAVLSMMTGAGALIAVSLIVGLLKAQVAVNLYTVFISLTLGVPGVALILLKMYLI
ncbi:MAG: pro-sigmaK processing inhibitor BofA family protein [Oscillospiraceae bacterium]|nr:pro-sigmaK processing inhibitor BofA family protein [Oscillospiraceae bacterium]